jgi:hypothetical protein
VLKDANCGRGWRGDRMIVTLLNDDDTQKPKRERASTKNEAKISFLISRQKSQLFPKKLLWFSFSSEIEGMQYTLVIFKV